ncbi:MAG: hypothetical protein D6714_11060 [Bacteroidetes bacterium]|nr:MAG: hypothetical protein D6714_11060 [Bacteroidota bacterium]
MNRQITEKAGWFLERLIDLIFYSNLWIAVCALAMTLQTELLIAHRLVFGPMAGFVFFSTLFLYAIHRIVGLFKVQPFTEKGRYKVISNYKSHILIYAGLAGLAGFYYFIQLSRLVQCTLLLPGAISLGYVLPFLGGKKRLRDIGLIKIFLIAIVWAWVTVLLPAIELEAIADPAVWIMALERALFIFAITLPFDIRDLSVDAHNQVPTIPAKIGIPRTRKLGIYLLLAMIFLVNINYQIGFYEGRAAIALIVSAVYSGMLVYFSDPNRHDYYYTGAVDGTMLVQFLLVWGAMNVF